MGIYNQLFVLGVLFVVVLGVLCVGFLGGFFCCCFFWGGWGGGCGVLFVGFVFWGFLITPTPSGI